MADIKETGNIASEQSVSGEKVLTPGQLAGTDDTGGVVEQGEQEVVSKDELSSIKQELDSAFESALSRLKSGDFEPHSSEKDAWTSMKAWAEKKFGGKFKNPNDLWATIATMTHVDLGEQGLLVKNRLKQMMDGENKRTADEDEVGKLDKRISELENLKATSTGFWPADKETELQDLIKKRDALDASLNEWYADFGSQSGQELNPDGSLASEDGFQNESTVPGVETAETKDGNTVTREKQSDGSFIVTITDKDGKIISQTKEDADGKPLEVYVKDGKKVNPETDGPEEGQVRWLDNGRTKEIFINGKWTDGDKVLVANGGTKLGPMMTQLAKTEDAELDQFEKEEALKKETAKLKEEYGEKVAKNFNDWRKERKAREDRLRAAEVEMDVIKDRLLNTKIDTNRFWKNTSGPAAMLMFAGIMVSGSSGAAVNSAAMNVDRMIQNDLDAQKTDLLNVQRAGQLQNNLISSIRLGIGDLDASVKIADAFLQKQFINDLDVMILNEGSPARKAKLVALQAQRKLKLTQTIEAAKQQLTGKLIDANAKNKQLSAGLIKHYGTTYKKDEKYFDVASAEGHTATIMRAYFNPTVANQKAAIQSMGKLNDPGVTHAFEIKFWQSYGSIGERMIKYIKKLQNGTMLEPHEMQQMAGFAHEVMAKKIKQVKRAQSSMLVSLNAANKLYGMNIPLEAVVGKVLKDGAAKKYGDRRYFFLKSVMAMYPHLKDTNAALDFIEKSPYAAKFKALGA